MRTSCCAMQGIYTNVQCKHCSSWAWCTPRQAVGNHVRQAQGAEQRKEQRKGRGCTHAQHAQFGCCSEMSLEALHAAALGSDHACMSHAACPDAPLCITPSKVVCVACHRFDQPVQAARRWCSARLQSLDTCAADIRYKVLIH